MAEETNTHVKTLTRATKDNSLLLLEKQLKDEKFSIEDIDYVFAGIKDIANAASKMSDDNMIRWQLYYVGICTDFNERVLKAHAAKEDYFVLNTEDEKFSRLIERFCVKYRGAKGDTGGGTLTASPKQVYIYLIKEHTIQNIQEKVIKS